MVLQPVNSFSTLRRNRIPMFRHLRSTALVHLPTPAAPTPVI
jgi:hypothetical protein